MDIRLEKQKYRDSIKERMNRFKPDDRVAESRSVCRRLLEQLPEETFTIGVYYPMTTEVNIVPLIQELLDRGCTVYMPRAAKKGFAFHQVTSLATLVPGPFGVLEPPADTLLLDKKLLDIVLVPGIAFDRECHRLGRGNGGYDVWLSHVREQNTRVKIWGICFENQILNNIPTEAHDQKMDSVVTARETYGEVR